jgi:hypothetical protein
MDADFVTLGHDAALFIGVQERSNCWDIKRGIDVVLPEQVQDAWNADTVAELPP